MSYQGRIRRLLETRFTFADGRQDGQRAVTHQQLQTLAVVLDGALPVLRRLTSADRLELVRRQPRLRMSHAHAGTSRARQHARQVQVGLVVAARDRQRWTSTNHVVVRLNTFCAIVGSFRHVLHAVGAVLVTLGHTRQ